MRRTTCRALGGLAMAAIGATCFASATFAAPVKVAGCADASEVQTRGIRLAPAKPPAGGEVPLLSLRVFAKSGARQSRGEERAICPGAILASGDQLWLDIKVGRPAYLYVVIARQDGSATLLYPPAGQVLLAQAQRALTVPANGNVFELDNVTGEERFWVVATEGPLQGSDADLAALMKRLEDRPWAAAPAGPGLAAVTSPPRPRASQAKTQKGGGAIVASRETPTRSQSGPDVAQLHTRGIIMKRDETTLDAWAPDRGGVVIAPFWIRHVAHP